MSDSIQDILVIGAGIIGLATAYELAKRGAKVTVVENKEPGWAASHGNAGMIYPAAGEPMVNPFHMKAGIRWALTRGGESPLQFSLLKLPSLMGWGLKALSSCSNKNHVDGKKAFGELGEDSLRLFAEYKKEGVKYEEHPGGFLAAFLDEKEFKRLSKFYSQVSSIELLSGDEAREREPILSNAVVGAAQLTEGFTSVYPPTVSTGLVQRLKQMGVEIRKGVQVVGANKEGNKITSVQTTSEGSFEADQFVVAAGGWSGQVAKTLGSHIPITGGKGYAITLKDPSVSPKQTVFLTEYEAVIIPFDGAVRFTGFLELSGVNMDILPRRIKALRHVVGRYIKNTPSGGAEEQWAGMRACTPDGVPAIGKLPKLDNGWVGSGHWHFGLTLGPPTAVMLAELITTGHSSVNPRPFDPARF